MCWVEDLAIGGNKTDKIKRLEAANRKLQNVVALKSQDRKKQQKTAFKEVEEELKTELSRFMVRILQLTMQDPGEISVQHALCAIAQHNPQPSQLQNCCCLVMW